MNKADIPFLSATALGELIRQREVSPVEATEAYLERIDVIDSTLHSYITVCRQEALQAARAAEQELARGEHRGPLHGVPYAVKDQFWTKDLLTTGGSTILGDFVPNEDATVVARLRASGAILLGKLNMFCALKGATHTPRLARWRHSAVTTNDLPASLEQPMIMMGLVTRFSSLAPPPMPI